MNTDYSSPDVVSCSNPPFCRPIMKCCAYVSLIFTLISFYSAEAQIQFVVKSLPENTASSDSIFITGTFNNWVTNDPNYLLIKQPNGSLAITLKLEKEAIEYKLTRGSWLKVETSKSNTYIPNRIYLPKKAHDVVSIDILNWQDLGGARRFEYIVFYYFSMAILGLALIVLIHRIQKGDARIVRIISIVNGTLVLLFMGIVSYFIVNPIWQTYIIIVGQVIIFMWGPLVYFFVQYLVYGKSISPLPHIWPGLLAIVIAVMQLLNFESVQFLSTYVHEYLTWGKLLLILTGVLHTLGYIIWLVVKYYRERVESNVYNKDMFVLIFLVIQIVAIGFIFINISADYFAITHSILTDFNICFVTLSLIVILESYYLWREPMLLREKQHVFHIDDSEQILEKLNYAMEVDKIYRDAELNIHGLADLIGTKSHILSKLLNEHHEQNFRDFVNGFRVNEFIEQANAGKLKKLTFLGLAHEVGFNSKSTFNLAFKKFTNQSPREYFKSAVV